MVVVSKLIFPVLCVFVIFCLLLGVEFVEWMTRTKVTKAALSVLDHLIRSSLLSHVMK